MQPGKIIKIFTSKKGNTVTIRYPKAEDLDDVLQFANAIVDEDIYVDVLSEPVTREVEEKWLIDTLEKIEQGKKIQLVAEINSRYAGNCEIRIRDKRQSHVGEIGIALAKEYREEGKKIGLKLLILNCFENNDRALHLYEKLGFTRSGLVPGVYAYKGSYVGEVTFYLPIK